MLAPLGALHLAGAGRDAWSRIAARGFLLAGVPLWLPPFGAPSRAGPWVGLDVALVCGLAAQVLGDPHRVRLLPVTADERLWVVRHGEVDVVAAAYAAAAAGRPVGPPEGVRLVGPYFTDRLALLVRRGARLASVRQLDGQAVGVLPGGAAAAALARALRGAGLAAVHEVGGAGLGMREVTVGRLRALVAGRAVLAALATYDPALAVQELPGLGGESYWMLLGDGAAAGDRLEAAAHRTIAALPRGRALQVLLRGWSAAAADPWTAV